MLSTTKPWLRNPLGLGLLIAGLLALVAIVEPAGLGLPWTCRLNQLTGLHCPGCGATRATQNLLRGELFLALQQNVLWVASLPVLGAGLLLGLIRRRQGKALPRIPAWMWWTFGLLTLVFFVLRNLPGEPYSWLRPPTG